MTEIKRSRKILSYQPFFVPLILSRDKTMTRRLDKWYDIGDILTGKEGRCGKAFCRKVVIGFKRERLQDIRVDDVIKEGYEGLYIKTIDHFLAFYDIAPSALTWFSDIWDSINKKPGTRWQDNPVVSVIEFKLVK